MFNNTNVRWDKILNALSNDLDTHSHDSIVSEANVIDRYFDELQEEYNNEHVATYSDYDPHFDELDSSLSTSDCIRIR